MKIGQDRRVLTDLVRKLARAAVAIKEVFHHVEQDIEWVFAKGQLYIVQSRTIPGGLLDGLTYQDVETLERSLA